MENIARTMYHRELQLVKDGIEEGKDIINILGEIVEVFLFILLLNLS